MAGSLVDTATAAIQKALADLSLGDGVLRISVEEVVAPAPDGASTTHPAQARPAQARPAQPTPDRDLRICKSEEVGEEHYVLGVVLEPDTTDSQGDIYTAETIRETAYLFMEEYQNIGLQHSGLINDSVKILESWIQRDDATIGGQSVKAGTWMLAVRVIDDDLWQAVKDGRITGFSIGGTGRRTPIVS